MKNKKSSNGSNDFFQKSLDIINYIVLFGVLLAVIVFTYFYVYNEDPIYIFDYSGYFENFKNMGKLFVTDFSLFWKTLIDSIRNLDYNYSSVVPLMIFYKFGGDSRLTYIMGLTVLYVFPSILLMVKAFIDIIISKDKIPKKEKNMYFIFAILITFMYTRLWSPTLRGLSDISGFIPIIISYLLISKRSLLKEKKLYFPILLGFVVYLPFLFRRWYVYYIISFGLSLFILDLIEFFQKYRDKKTFFNAFKNYFLMGLTILSLVLICQFPLVKSILAQNYQDAYSGFQTTLLGHIEKFYNEFGLIIIILSLLGVILSLVRKKYRKETAFCLLNILIFSITFGSVQHMGVHHFLGITFWIYLLFMLGIRHIYELIPKYKLGFLGLILVLFALNFATTFIFRDKSIPVISQNNKYYKFRYYNFAELERLIGDIEALMVDSADDKEENHKFTVIAESEIISDNLIDLLGNTDIKDNLVYTTHVDSRDGLNFNSLWTKYVVVTSQSQMGTNSKGQYTIDIPNQMILKGKGIGKAYQKLLGPYYLDGEVEAYIYEKERNFTEEEVKEYLDAYYKIYPEWENEYSFLDKQILASKVYMGSYYGNFKRIDNDTYFFFPGHTNTYIDIPINKEVANIKLKFYVDYNGDNEEAGIVQVEFKSGKNSLKEIEVTNQKEEIVELDLQDKKNLKIEVKAGEELIEDWLFMDVVDVEYGEK